MPDRLTPMAAEHFSAPAQVAVKDPMLSVMDQRAAQHAQVYHVEGGGGSADPTVLNLHQFVSQRDASGASSFQAIGQRMAQGQKPSEAITDHTNQQIGYYPQQQQEDPQRAQINQMQRYQQFRRLATEFEHEV